MWQPKSPGLRGSSTKKTQNKNKQTKNQKQTKKKLTSKHNNKTFSCQHLSLTVMKGIFLLLAFKCKKRFLRKLEAFWQASTNTHDFNSVKVCGLKQYSSVYYAAFLISESDPETHKTAWSNLWKHPSNQNSRNRRVEIKELTMIFSSLRAAANLWT